MSGSNDLVLAVLLGLDLFDGFCGFRLVGTYQHIDKKHLNRYLAEFDFRQNTRAGLGIDDVPRAKVAIRGMVGKRLTYRDSQ